MAELEAIRIGLRVLLIGVSWAYFKQMCDHGM